VEADHLGEVVRVDASGPQGDARPLEDAADRETVDAELAGELFDPPAGSVGGNELGRVWACFGGR
jgi:hypothetical protein